MNCCYRFLCTTLGIAASIVIGVITAFLTITAAITITPAFLWVLFGIAVVYLAVTLVTLANTRRGSPCICNTLQVLLAGILGTILTAVILLGITFTATSVIGAIIAGALLFFFSLTITSTACLVKCLANCEDND